MDVRMTFLVHLVLFFLYRGKYSSTYGNPMHQDMSTCTLVYTRSCYVSVDHGSVFRDIWSSLHLGDEAVVM